MREIRFRAWDKDKLEMITCLEGITQNRLGISNTENLKLLITINGDYCIPNWGRNIILMQYTGLKDKNGKEIYESDIVSIFTKDKSDKYFWLEAVFQDGAFGYPCISSFISFSQNDSFNWKNGQSKEIEIIGNIYENPDWNVEIKNQMIPIAEIIK